MYKLIKIDNYWIIVEFKKNFNINPNTLYLKKYPERITLSQYNGYGDWDIILYSTNPEHNLPSISFSDEVAKELGIIDVEKLAWDTINNNSSLIEDREQVVGFTAFYEGYNKSQETHPFSEEDMIEFHKWAFQQVRIKESDLTTKELLQLWKNQQCKIIYYE